jgi:hypothetical protein
MYYLNKSYIILQDVVTDFINALPGNSFINTSAGNNRRETVMYMRSTPSKSTDVGSLLSGNAALNIHPQQWETVFSVGSVQRFIYTRNNTYIIRNPCGGGVEYLHRDPASRRRRRKGSLKYETVNYGHESQRNETRERLRWRGIAAYAKDTSVLSSERAPQKIKTVTVNELKISGHEPQMGLNTKTY